MDLASLRVEEAYDDIGVTFVLDNFSKDANFSFDLMMEVAANQHTASGIANTQLFLLDATQAVAWKQAISSGSDPTLDRRFAPAAVQIANGAPTQTLAAGQATTVRIQGPAISSNHVALALVVPGLTVTVGTQARQYDAIITGGQDSAYIPLYAER